MPNAKRKVHTMPSLRQQNKGADTGCLLYTSDAADEL